MVYDAFCAEGPLSVKNQRHVGLIITVAALLAALSVSIFWVLDKIETQEKKRLGSSLQTVLKTTDQALKIWAGQTEIDATVLAEDEPLRSYVKAQLQRPRHFRDLVDTDSLRNIRRLLRSAMSQHGYLGFAVIAPDGLQVAAAFDETIGMEDISDHNPNLLPTVMDGRPALGLPFESPAFWEDHGHRKKPVMTVAAPIRDENGQIIAALAFRLDPAQEFTATTRLGRIGATGETYAFDRAGRLLTQSRFEQGILFLQIRDPGGNTLTRMADSAIHGHAGLDLTGYRDYRGVPVIGAWLWDDTLGIGLATEMDVSEADAPSHEVRGLITVMLFLIAAVAAALLLILVRHNRTRALNYAYSQAVKAREDMMASVSHDLKNPLGSLVMISHIVQQHIEGSAEPDAFIKKYMQQMTRTAQYMNKLISNLTDFARIQAGRLSINRQECFVDEIVNPAVETVVLLAAQKNIQLTQDIEEDLPRLFVDTTRMTEVLSNLLGNAVKFTPEHGRVELRVESVEKHVEFTVADNGPGIPPEALTHVFEQHWQANKTRSGMGLGLFIAKTVVEAHGGQIRVESTLGKGAKFSFRLLVHVPLDKPDRGPAQ
jgi:signal transduction histidine kinase